LPFNWYRSFVLTGARERGLPEAYIQEFLEVAVIADPDAVRSRENLALLGGCSLLGAR